MKYTEPGTYKIQYTAEDGCGKTTVEDRTVIVAPPPRTVLYTDGTLIINEQPEDRARNEALHGAATKEYVPFDPNGATDIEKYIFNEADRPWDLQNTSITSVELGESIAPFSMAYWFSNCRNLASVDLSLLDTSNTTDMRALFFFCRKLTSVDLSNFNTSEVTYMQNMFTYTGFSSLDLSNFNTSKVTNMSLMFSDCDLLTSLNISSFDTSKVENFNSMFNEVAITSLDLSNFDTSSATNMKGMFSYAKTKLLDLSSFDTSNVSDMQQMFKNCKMLETIYVQDSFVTTNVTISTEMFYNMSTKLKGGAGTVWNSSNPKDKTYARIDGGTSNPGYFTLKED